jgi:hypothetical protein
MIVNKTVTGLIFCLLCIVRGYSETHLNIDEIIVLQDGTLFFPKDAKQKSDKEVGAFSGARVTSNFITIWYMRAFGCPLPIMRKIWTAKKLQDTDLFPFQYGSIPSYGPISNADLPLAINGTKVLSLKSQNQCTLIRDVLPIDKGESFGESSENYSVPSPEDSEFFWRTFREMAENPIGRVLLYRILVEVLRIDHQGIGAAEIPQFPTFLVSRNDARSIYIARTDSWKFHSILRALSFSNTHASTVLHFDGRVLTSMVEEDYPLHCSLFHEFLHWYHTLRNPFRMLTEYQGLYYDQHAVLPSVLFSIEHFNAISQTADIVKGWIRSLDNKIELEEIRTILGGYKLDKYIITLLIDDFLSENVYRCYLGLRMRWGHVNMSQNFGTSVPAGIEYSRNIAFKCCRDITDAKRKWDWCPIYPEFPVVEE